MRLLSVNVGQAVPIKNGKASGDTGIYKRPASAPVAITRDGVADDHISDLENHGGVDQAVYIYGSVDYDWWSAELGREIEPGTFGENLTVEGLESAPCRIGDRLRVGVVLLEVTAPRLPCVTLAVRMDDPKFLRRFRAAARPGLYCRVITSGEVRAGDPVSLEPYPGAPFTAGAMFRLAYDPDADESALRLALSTPIDTRARREFEERLAALMDDA